MAKSKNTSFYTRNNASRAEFGARVIEQFPRLSDYANGELENYEDFTSRVDEIAGAVEVMFYRSNDDLEHAQVLRAYGEALGNAADAILDRDFRRYAQALCNLVDLINREEC